MAEDQKHTQNEFQTLCEGIPFADMMHKMVGAKKEGHPFNCAEMMSQVMQMCCGAPKEKAGSAPETEEKHAPGQ